MVWLILLGHRPHSIVQGARCCYPKQKDKTHQTCQLPGKFFGNSHFLDWLLTNWCLLLENKYFKCDRTQSWIWTQSLVSVRYQISKYCCRNLVSESNFIFVIRIKFHGFQSLEWSHMKDAGTLHYSLGQNIIFRYAARIEELHKKIFCTKKLLHTLTRIQQW